MGLGSEGVKRKNSAVGFAGEWGKRERERAVPARGILSVSPRAVLGEARVSDERITTDDRWRERAVER